MAVGTVVCAANAKRAICLMVNQATNNTAPSLSTDGVPNYPTTAQVLAETEVAACFPGDAAQESTLMISGTAYVKAVLDLASVTTHVNTVIRAVTAGPSGESITFRTVADGTGAGSLTLAGTAFTFHYQSTVTTVANLEAAIAALTGASAIIEVATPGTGANIFVSAADTFAATPLACPANAMVGTFTLWGYLAASDKWHKLTVNGGSALAETGQDSIGYQQRYLNLGHWDRLALQLASIGGTNAVFQAWLVTARTVTF